MTPSEIAAQARWDALNVWAECRCKEVAMVINRYIEELDRRIAEAARWEKIGVIVRTAPKIRGAA